jgi:hypothetical protein
MKPNHEDYKSEQARIFFTPSLFVVLRGLEVAK